MERFYYASQTTNVTTEETLTATDPFGNPYTYQQAVTHATHPNMALGVSVAAGVWAIAAIQAAMHASGMRHNALAAASGASDAAVAPVFAAGRGVMLGMRVRVAALH